MNIRDIKKTALKLFALNVEDRRWILRQLPADIRESVKEQLHELQKLGIAKDKFVINKVIDSELFSQRKENLETKGVNAKHLDIIKNASIENIISILKTEPVWIAAIILSVDDWPWKSEYLSQLSVTNKSEVKSIMSNKVGDFPKNIILVIIEEFAEELKEWKIPSPDTTNLEEIMNRNVISKDDNKRSDWWRRMWQ